MGWEWDRDEDWAGMGIGWGWYGIGIGIRMGIGIGMPSTNPIALSPITLPNRPRGGGCHTNLKRKKTHFRPKTSFLPLFAALGHAPGIRRDFFGGGGIQENPRRRAVATEHRGGIGTPQHPLINGDNGEKTEKTTKKPFKEQKAVAGAGTPHPTSRRGGNAAAIVFFWGRFLSPKASPSL